MATPDPNKTTTMPGHSTQIKLQHPPYPAYCTIIFVDLEQKFPLPIVPSNRDVNLCPSPTRTLTSPPHQNYDNHFHSTH